MKRLLLKIIRRLISICLATFTTDCPVCHRHFHGRRGYKTNVKIAGKHYRIICHQCARKHLPAPARKAKIAFLKRKK